MLMHDPPHPGAFIRRRCLEPLGLTVTDAAKGLAVSPTRCRGCSTATSAYPSRLAIRLSEAFDGSPESWLTQQT